MKKLIVAAMITILSASILSGCAAWEESVEENYPYVTYQHDWVNSSYDKKIVVPDGYAINDGYSYDIVETENGCDIVIHLVKNDMSD